MLDFLMCSTIPLTIGIFGGISMIFCIALILGHSTSLKQPKVRKLTIYFILLFVSCSLASFLSEGFTAKQKLYCEKVGL